MKGAPQKYNKNGYRNRDHCIKIRMSACLLLWGRIFRWNLYNWNISKYDTEIVIIDCGNSAPQ